MKRVVCSFVVVFAAITPPMVAEESNPPELVASLFPATGLIPVGNADHPVYRFEVAAQELDESGKVRTRGDALVMKVMEDTLVEPGQTRTISSPREREWRLEGAVTIRPYPFRRDSLSFSIMARRVPKRIYSDDQDFQTVLAASPHFPLKFTLNAPRTHGISQAAFH